MAKRGRPSNKVLKKRKQAKEKAQSYILIAVLMLIAALFFMYFTLIRPL